MIDTAVIGQLGAPALLGGVAVGAVVLDVVFTTFNFPSWLLEVYTNNPLTLAVLGFHRAFWIAGSPAEYPPHLAIRMAIAILIGSVLVWICQRVFAKLQGNFAQEL